MKGNNTLSLCKSEMIAAIQEYIENLLGNADGVRVTDVKMDNSTYAPTFIIELECTEMTITTTYERK